MRICWVLSLPHVLPFLEWQQVAHTWPHIYKLGLHATLFQPLTLCSCYVPVIWPCCPCVLGHLSRVWLSATLWTVAHQAPLFKGILQARILEWVAMPPPGGLPDPGIRTTSLTSPAWAGRFFTTSTTWEASIYPLWRTNYWGIWLDVYIFQEITEVKDKAFFFFFFLVVVSCLRM